MRTGKLAISRGHRLGSTPITPRLGIVGSADTKGPAFVSPEYQPVHDRLAALERLARLRKQGALTPEEFVAEKAMILGRYADELVLNEPLLADDVSRGPSLVDRLFGLKIIPVGIAAGLALSFAAQPEATIRFFGDALRLFGA